MFDAIENEIKGLTEQLNILSSEWYNPGLVTIDQYKVYYLLVAKMERQLEEIKHEVCKFEEVLSDQFKKRIYSDHAKKKS